MDVQIVNKLKSIEFDLPFDEMEEHTEISICNRFFILWKESILNSENNIDTIDKAIDRGKLIFNNLQKNSMFTYLPKHSQRYVKKEINNMFLDFKALGKEQKLQSQIVEKTDLIEFLKEQVNNLTQTIKNNLPNINQNGKNDNLEPTQINIQEIYLEHKEEYFDWLNEEFPSDRSRDTKNGHKRVIKKIFGELNIVTSNDFKIYFRRLKVSEDDRTNITFRNFIKFCQDKYYLTEIQIQTILGSIKGGIKRKGREKKRINDEEMQVFVKNVKDYLANPNPKNRKLKQFPPEIFYLFVCLSIESGVRIISLKEDMFSNFDINRLEQEGEVSRYNLNKEKTNEFDNKGAGYLYCRTKTINKIIEYYNKGLITPSFYNTFEENIIDWLREENKEVILFKFHRKYFKSICRKNGISKEYMEFFSSRISNLDIGDLNYEDFDRFAFGEYEKIIPDLNELLD